jgi:type I restriction enzyme S subunit
MTPSSRIGDTSRLDEWNTISGGQPIPDGWRLVRLGEVSDHCLGKMLDKEKQVIGTHLPYLRNPNIQWFRIDLDNLEEMRFQEHELDRYEIRTGDVIICEGGEPGRAAIWEDGQTNIKFQKALHRVRTRPDLSKRFLVHQLFRDARSGRLSWYFTGTTIKHFTGQDLDRYLFPLPPIDQQHRIVGILDKADAIRRKLEESIRLTEELLRSAFRHLFGDPIGNSKAWKLERLGEHIAFMTSGSRGWAEFYSPNGFRFIRSLDVQMNRIGEDDRAFVNPPQNVEAARTRVQEGDVLVTITGSKVGRVCFVPEGFGPAYVSQHVAILRLSGRIRPRFLSMFLTDEHGGQRQIKASQYGQTKPGLNLDQIRGFLVPCPPLEVQDRFLAIWDQYDYMLCHKMKALEQSNRLFDSLVQRAFLGEL